MCLDTEWVDAKKTKKQILRLVVKTAKTNKTVYKRFKSSYIKGILTTPFQSCYWGYNELKEVEKLGISLDHSTSLFQRKRKRFKRLQVGVGLHAWISLKRAKECKAGSFTRKMVIPKGAKYIVGDRGDIVATQMLLPEKSKAIIKKKKVAKKANARKKK